MPILWSSNPVHLQCLPSSGFRHLSYLQSFISPLAFQSIRTLEFSFVHSVPDDRCILNLDDQWFSNWAGLWETVKGMKGLVRILPWIKMDQEIGENVMTAEQEQRLFAPLMGVLRVWDFNVEVTWPPAGDELDEKPFNLVRKDEPIPGKVTLAKATQYVNRI